MSTQPQTAVVISGPPEYSLAKGLKKAGIQVATVAGAAALTALVAMLEDPEVQGQIVALVKGKAWAPILTVLLQVLLAVAINWRKNSGAKANIEAATIEASPAAAAVSVQDQLDRNESPAPAVVLTEKEPQA